jgi:hypothetical protein
MGKMKCNQTFHWKIWKEETISKTLGIDGKVILE